jgi:glycosyltransferase involved in cell wall biosynthesis
MNKLSTPKISVCLPTFNGAKYVGLAIDSILAQSFQDFELIVCDDRSSDNTPQIIRTYADRDDRVKFTTNSKRLGLFQNYNECISKSQGQFIKPFAQDDVLAPKTLARMIEAFSRNDHVVLVSSARKWIDANGMETKQIAHFHSDTVLKGKDVIMAHLIGLSNWIGEPSAVMFKAGATGNKFDTGFHHYGDIEYWLRILEHGSLLYLSEPLCSFRRHDESSTSTNLNGLYFAADIFRLGKKYESYLKELGETPEHFGKRAVEVIALHLDHLVRTEGLSEADVLAAKSTAQPILTLEDQTSFRQALFYSERRITSLLEELIATRNELEHKEGECQRLWAALNQLTSSVSWKLTAPLRNVRAKMSPTQR